MPGCRAHSLAAEFAPVAMRQNGIRFHRAATAITTHGKSFGRDTPPRVHLSLQILMGLSKCSHPVRRQNYNRGTTSVSLVWKTPLSRVLSLMHYAGILRVAERESEAGLN
jgi:hypothetical protein